MRRAIAIVGAAGRFPGAPTLDALWPLIEQKRCAIRPVPAGRWPLRPEALLGKGPDRLRHGMGAFLDEAPPGEVLAAAVAKAAWRQAGAEALDRRRVSVVLANIVLPTEEASRFTRETVGAAFGAWATGRKAPGSVEAPRGSIAGAAEAVAERLGLGGGAFTLDAACASSLYALHLACLELEAGRADAVLAGGMSLPQSLYTQVGFSQLQALSPSGRCLPFDARADGLVVGEGAAIFVLQRLEDAVAAGRPILALIRGIGVSNDVGGSLLSPTSEGQLRAMRAAYAQAGWDPATVDLFECHGTGTPRGDAVELATLHALLRESGRAAPVPIGSVKSNIGHLLTAAGSAGLAKLLLALRHGTLPPTAGFSRESALPGPWWERLRVLEGTEPWEKGDKPRRAALSAFGFGGSNAHLLLEEWVEQEAPRAAPAASAEGEDRETRVELHAVAPVLVAIVGMGAHFGRLRGLEAFRRAIFEGKAVREPVPPARWKGLPLDGMPAAAEGPGAAELQALLGAFIEHIDVALGRYRIPPAELESLLPQQLLALQVALDAVEDAGGLGQPPPRQRHGVVVGLGLDWEATSFHLRWLLPDFLRRWAAEAGQALDEAALARWEAALLPHLGPALDASRTLGALGGVVASRIARELHFGGPSLTLGAGEASGLRALEVAARLLASGEADAMIACAVDLAGDLRAVLARAKGWSVSEVRPLDEAAAGAFPGEGAGALLLKRLDDALRSGDRVYAVLEGVGFATGESGEAAAPLALRRARGEGEAHVSFVSSLASGDPLRDRALARSLAASFRDGERASIALGSVAAVVGESGAAAGIAAVIQSALALAAELLPPLPGLRRALPALGGEAGPFFAPREAEPWLRNRAEGPRRAAVHWIGERSAAHAILRAAEAAAARRVEADRARGAALFLVQGDFPTVLEELRRHLETSEEIETSAAAWHRKHPFAPGKPTRAIVGSSKDEILARLAQAAGEPPPAPPGPVGEVAFVFPGSGNHRLGALRRLGACFPRTLRRLDEESPNLLDQLMPRWLFPRRLGWADGWEKASAAALAAEPVRAMLSQVGHGIVASDLLRDFGLRPAAMIGYSIGESTALFASRTWRDRAGMFRRTLESPLFRSELFGPCEVAQRAWGCRDPRWRAALIGRGAEELRPALRGSVELLIVNAPGECVIGGKQEEVEAVAALLEAPALFLDAVPISHSSLLEQVAEAYRSLHLLPTEPPEDIRIYSCGWAKSYVPTREACADSILANALHGFDFTRVIEQAWEDGVRVFVEVGPSNSCSRMIDRILAGRPFLSLSIDHRDRDPLLALLQALGRLAEAGVPVDLSPLYGEGAVEVREPAKARGSVRISIGKALPAVAPPPPWTSNDTRHEAAPPENIPMKTETFAAMKGTGAVQTEPVAPVGENGGAPQPRPAPLGALPGEALNLARMASAVARAHTHFLENAAQAMALQQAALAQQQRLLAQLLGGAPGLPPRQGAGALPPAPPPAAAAPGLQGAPTEGQRPPSPAAMPAAAPVASEAAPRQATKPEPASLAPPPEAPAVSAPKQPLPSFTREQCLEFATGSLARLFGPAFARVDEHPTRVRLPDEPLMLVDRILEVSGPLGVRGPVGCVTEHDVLPGAWYLDGDRAPVCISLEAGQADLFLCAWAGMDLITEGKQVYRLLDALVTFHRDLPRPGETIRYDIRVRQFIQQGSTHLLFFEYDATIDGAPFLTMRNGCAGFFSPAQLAAGRGIVDVDATPRPAEARPLCLPDARPFRPLVPVESTSLDEGALDALRAGDAEAAFGPAFAGIRLPPSLRLPDGRMRLVHRILELDPAGGRHGLGRIIGEADIDPEAWFLRCHFVDDQVMPGTLMYECCQHTLRIFLLRLGWAVDEGDIGSAPLHLAPVPEQKSRLRCRGQVTAKTRKVHYRIDLKEIGYGPEPYVLADASMLVDGLHAVEMENMSVRLVGMDQERLEAFWARRGGVSR